MTDYLEQEYDWPGARSCGRIRRSRKHLGADVWESQQTHTWVSSLSLTQITACELAQILRKHWTIENGVFRIRDVSYDEDRLHGRKIAYCLSDLLDMAINIVRSAAYPYIPDGWRDIACKPDHGLPFLMDTLKL